jgi:adenylate cyclase
LRSDLIDPILAVHHGRVVKRTGDGALIEFRSVVDAVRCAIEVQRGLAERNAGLPPEKRIEYRVGIHLGDVVGESDGLWATGSILLRGWRASPDRARSVSPRTHIAK